jgi:acetyl esterase/lipase
LGGKGRTVVGEKRALTAPKQEEMNAIQDSRREVKSRSSATHAGRGRISRRFRFLVGLAGFLLLSNVRTLVADETLTSPERIPLWPGQAPIGNGDGETSNAFITVFHPSVTNGAAVVICPGGGYGGLVTGPEGIGIARWLNDHGITGIVLEYRLPHGRPFVPLLDAQRAIRTVRAQAKEWGCDPARIGIIGFSAGGHLASTAATHYEAGNPLGPDPIERTGCRPDFAILIYPLITMGEKTHLGSKANLLGPDPTPEIVRKFSNALQVTGQTPATFLAHALDDEVVSAENSRIFYEALLAHGVDAQFLELPSGGHGLNGYKGPMWDAWQTKSLQWLVSIKMIPPRSATGAARSSAAITFPSFQKLAAGAQQVRLLPGQNGFVFNMYGAPGELDKVEQLVEVMHRQQLGNGFDPGPSPRPDPTALIDYLAKLAWPVVFYSGGEMQIKDGRAVFGHEMETALAPMDRTGVFNAYQLGEWGYYFHNLSPNESWWHDVYGKDFDAYKHLMKPKGLAGYDRRPATRRECYEAVKNYFMSRKRDLLDRVISVTGHSHYEAYAGEWGARCIGLEVGENIAFTQSKLAFARGASRQWRTPWSVQVSPWFSGACTTSGPLRTEGHDARGLEAGHSLSFYERMWLHGWFAGAAMVTPENSIAIFFEKAEAPWTLTSHGRKAAEVFPFMQSHDRGVPYTPVAVVLDHLNGYNAYMDKPWGILDPTPGDREIRDLFDHQLFPGSDHIHVKPDPENPEASYLRPTPFGEIFDVLLTSVSPGVLPAYPVILLAGDIEFDHAFVAELEKALRGGSRLLMSARHRESLGAAFERLATEGEVEVLESWTNPVTDRPAAISNGRLGRLAKDLLPFEITGDAIQYEINRIPHGWVVELINNRGVVKKPNQPAFTDSTAAVHVRLQPKVPVALVQEWRSGRKHNPTGPIEIEVGPGAVEFVELLELTK